MSLRPILTLAAVAVLTFGIAAGVSAQGNTTAPAEDFAVPTDIGQLVDARKALMRDNGATMGKLADLTGDEAVTALEHLKTNFSHIPPLFPEGSTAENSRALPAIWEQWDKFTGIAQSGQDAADAAITAAKGSDAAAYAAAVQKIGPICGECHGQFRAK